MNGITVTDGQAAIRLEITPGSASIVLNDGGSAVRLRDLAAPGPVGLRGQGGLSAYQVAQANGFMGSEAEWLESLKARIGLPAGYSSLIVPGDGVYLGYANYQGSGWRIIRLGQDGAIVLARVANNPGQTTLPPQSRWPQITYTSS